MNKFNPNKVGKQTLVLCTEIANNETYTTAPLTIYQRIRTQFTVAQTVDQVVGLGYPQELVELIYAETFK